MKVLMINGSPHKHGGTGSALKVVKKVLHSFDIETEIMDIGNDAIRGCTACFNCKKTGSNRCVFDDDAVNKAIDAAESADGLIIASPVYYAGIPGTMKSFLDRFFFASNVMEFKPAAAISCTRRAGAVTVFHQLNNYLNLRKVLIVPSQYWNVIHGTNETEIYEDKEGIQILQTLGKNMAWLLKVVENGKDIPTPEDHERIATNFIR